MLAYVRLDNSTTKPRFHEKNSQSSKNEKNIHYNVPEDKNNLVQARLGGEFWAGDVTMHIRHITLSLVSSTTP